MNVPLPEKQSDAGPVGFQGAPFGTSSVNPSSTTWTVRILNGSGKPSSSHTVRCEGTSCSTTSRARGRQSVGVCQVAGAVGGPEGGGSDCGKAVVDGASQRVGSASSWSTFGHQ